MPRCQKQMIAECPECDVEGVAARLDLLWSRETDWYGQLAYYQCPACRIRFVQQDDGDMEIAAE